MRKVMVYAYTNFNLGDDLFIKVLCERYPDIRFVLHAPSEYKDNFKDLSNIVHYPSDSILFRGINFLFRKLKINISTRRLLAKRCDAIVNIGGSIFIQQDGWQDKLKDRKSVQNKPFFLLGANFGPYSDEDYYVKYKELFKDYRDVCFRERYSYELFKNLSNVRMADDVIFQLNTKDEIKIQDNNIVISVIKPSFRKYLANYDDVYYNKIKDITKHFVDKGYKVTLMSFCENEGDKEAVEKIMSIIPGNYLNKVTDHLYKKNIEETLNIIKEARFIVGTRFHAMILGWVYNKPVFPIAYSDKMTNVMKDINFNGYYTDFDNIHELKSEDVFKSMETNFIDVSKQVINAEKQFEKLDEYLQKQ